MCVYGIGISAIHFYLKRITIVHLLSCMCRVLQPQCYCNVTVYEVHLLSVCDVLPVVFLLTSDRYFVTKRVAINGIYRNQHEASHSLWFVLVTRLHVKGTGTVTCHISKIFNAECLSQNFRAIVEMK